MTKKVFTEKELAEALKNGEDTIEIVGDLAGKTIKIRATGKVAWAIAFGAIGVAVYSAVATLGSGGASAPATGTAAAFTAPVAVGILGIPATLAAISIAIAGGGLATLTRLRGYNETFRTENSLILKKK